MSVIRNRVWWLLLSAGTFGCLVTIDESRIVEGTSSSSGVSGLSSSSVVASTASGTSGAGGKGPQNLLLNPSFEDWSQGEPLVWDWISFTPEESNDAHLGSSALRLKQVEVFSGVRQAVSFADPLPTGSNITASIWTKFESGTVADGTLSLTLLYSDGTPADFPGLGDFAIAGSWTNFQASIVSEHPISEITLSAGGTAGMPVFLIDDASLIVEPP